MQQAELSVIVGGPMAHYSTQERPRMAMASMGMVLLNLNDTAKQQNLASHGGDIYFETHNRQRPAHGKSGL
jgi:hypothetical protein